MLKEEGRRKKEEGRRKKEEEKFSQFFPSDTHPLTDSPLPPLSPVPHSG
jgi:hypothetical protein